MVICKKEMSNSMNYDTKVKQFLLIVSFIIIISVIIVYIIGTILTQPSQQNIGEAPIELHAQDVSFKSKNGNVLSGWFIQGDVEKGGILLLHGVRSNRLQMLNRAKFLNDAGYSVLLFDFQAHGESIGNNITFGYLESVDAEAGFAFLKSKIKDIGVIGVSLGGASALLGSVATQSKALVLESVYPSLEEAILNRLNIRFGKFGAFLLPLLSVQIKPRLGFEVEALQPIKKISDVSSALLIIAGELDRHTTLAQSQNLFDRAKSKKEFWIVKGAGHINYDKYQPIEYKERVLKFFEVYLVVTSFDISPSFIENSNCKPSVYPC